MRVVIIPLWLANKLEAANLPLTVVLDTERLSTILSKEDLFFLQTANECNKEVCGSIELVTIRQDFPTYSLDDCCLSVAESQLIYPQLQGMSHGERQLLIFGDIFNSEKTSKVVLNYETAMIAPEVCAVKIVESSKTDSLSEFLEIMQGQVGDKQVYGLECFRHFIEKV